MSELELLREAHRLHVAEVDAVCAHLAAKAEEGGTPIQCRAGCTSCCRFWVEIGPLEAIEIAHYLRAEGRDTPALRLKLEAAGKLMEAKSHAAFWALGRFCALLVDGRCSVYPVRPVACRLHNSVTDPKTCDGAVGKRIEVPGLLDEHAAFCRATAEHPALKGWPALGPLPGMVARALKSCHD